MGQMLGALKRRVRRALRETLHPETSPLSSLAGEARVAYEPALVPPIELMRTEGIDVLEDWFRWGEEWSVLLRAYSGLRTTSDVLEIGCGLGRIAFPLRYVIRNGTYCGFDNSAQKIEFLQRSFTPAHPNFRFDYADVLNTEYNPNGTVAASSYRFPYADAQFDIAYAASLFTHMLPEACAHYFAEASRVLKPAGRCLFSFFLLDFFRPGHPRPYGFAHSRFDFAHSWPGYGSEFAFVAPDNPELMTAYSSTLIRKMAEDAGLAVTGDPIPGLWSGTRDHFVGSQDLVVLCKA
jgi:SAM-dependent methyltransferase